MKSLVTKVSILLIVLSAFSTQYPCLGADEVTSQQKTLQYETSLLDLLNQDAGLAKQRAEVYQQIVGDIDKFGGATPNNVKTILVLAHERGRLCLKILNFQIDGGRYTEIVEAGTRIAGDLKKDIGIGIENKAKGEEISEIRGDVSQIYTLVSKAYKALGQEDEGNRVLQNVNEPAK